MKAREWFVCGLGNYEEGWKGGQVEQVCGGKWRVKVWTGSYINSEEGG